MNLFSSNDHNALLIYHCRVVSEMNYNISGSTSTPWRAKSGLENFFDLSSAIDLKWRVYHTTSNWQGILESQLDNGRPIIYSGGSLDGGHTWVIDGYYSDGSFNCNWGWYGDYNGPYHLGEFEPGSSNFNMVESAIVNIFPNRLFSVGQPTLTGNSIYAKPTQISVTPVEPASGYEWTTTNGTITGSGHSVNLYTNLNTTVCVRALNSQCDIASEWSCANFTVLPGSISGIVPVCSSNRTFSLNHLPLNASITWTKSSNLVYVSGQNTINYTVKASSSTNSSIGWVKAYVSNGSIDYGFAEKTFWVGTPPPSSLVGPFDGNGSTGPACKGEPYQFEVPRVREVTSYQWRIISPSSSSWWSILSSSNIETYCTDNFGTHTMGVKQKMDGCSWSQETTLSFPVVECNTGNTCGGTGGGPKLLIAPNPASIEITISEIEPANDNIPWVLRLMSGQGAVMVNVTTVLPQTLSVQGLQPGVYVLHARRGSYSEQQVVVIE